jgi:DNA polymerase IV
MIWTIAMTSSPRFPQLPQHDSDATASLSPPPPTKLDLSQLPPIFVSATHFETEDLHELEDELAAAGAHLTYDLREARIVLSKVRKPKRVAFDLRVKGLWTEHIPEVKIEENNGAGRACKRKKTGPSGHGEEDVIVIDEETESELAESVRQSKPGRSRKRPLEASSAPYCDKDVVNVLRLAWFRDSVKAGCALPFNTYLTYRCRAVVEPRRRDVATHMAGSIGSSLTDVPAETLPSMARSPDSPASTREDILDRAKEDAQSSPSQHTDRFGRRGFKHQSNGPISAGVANWAASSAKQRTQYTHLLHKTTTEDEGGYASDLPEMPDWVKQGVKYACQRQSPMSGPNEAFIGMLKKIRLARTLTNDEIGVRAYSTSIAALAAYPYKLSNPREILALPGCEAKIANLFVEYANTGSIKAVEELESDTDLTVLRLFYEIWGVGATTAREFYFDRGWRDLDDIVEYGWGTLSRVQQIGVKYYDEFLDPIPRLEVEHIAATIHRHAVKVRDDKIQSVLVGGYRRGKVACGDVDIVLSHPDEERTMNIVNDIVASLEEEGWITHTLLLSLHNSHRNQETLPYRSREGPSGSHGGFDTLDKALVVWQDPVWPTKEADTARTEASGEKLRNPNIHRRVDIIISPWRTVGCAVAGWSGGTTFQRDLRRYAKNMRSWKFDSSGVRDRAQGEVVDLEGWHIYKGKIGKGRATDMLQAERRVFEGMGLPWVEPHMRNTG